ncbi:polyribonucleotide nucleotidyltransferase [Candidatus Dependentiae bacterium]|nr:polyribonucleotide nucleotidyltransferase [Candidatus Dependentiae bacterium]
MSKIFKLPELGFEVEVDKFARQADGAAWLRHGDTIVLSTAVATSEERDFIGFFPLTVEYREKTSAAGKFPGGYIKREGRLNDTEVLSSRLIDRPIRPLFPKYYFNEVQVISSVYSYDGKFPSAVLGLIASSLALTISKIPFLGPVGAVQVGRVDGKWVLNTSAEEMKESSVDLIVAGTNDGICMVEGHCDLLSEADLIEALFLAHEQIKVQVKWQLDIKKELSVEEPDLSSVEVWKEWEEKVQAHFKPENCETLFAPTKAEQSEALKALKKDVVEFFEKEIESGITSKPKILYLFDSLLKEYLPNLVAQKNSRLDGRPFDQVRPITAEIGLLPTVHGSAMFRRGETQALASLTLGTAQDAQRMENLKGDYERTFMLHYNFPPFSTGEVKPIRGVGRREIGHGYLAERSFAHVLPEQDKFPYTIRSVVDMFESNGSSSMATVCATTLALMDAGVPIKDMVGGIAMGMMKDSDGNTHVLTDILGSEDAFGLMDFKITGTDTGIMAVQMDIKAKAGLTRDLLERALEQARTGRLHIIKTMRDVLDKPRAQLSELAPRVISLKIDPEKIGTVIGPGGKSIKEITASTNTQIDITDDGLVRIYSSASKDAHKAEQWVRTLVGDIEVGTTVDGIVRRVAEFGMFVELVPGKDGLVHISSIARDRQRTLAQDFKVGDTLKVKVVAVEEETGRIRLIAPDLK